MRAKNLLLTSAATLFSATAVQAADLPVKAKPVEYVKVCSLYGAGFYYMPGTDLCIKVGGWMRAEAGWGNNGNLTWGPFNANTNQRTTNNLAFKFRGYITADVRNQTEYGTVRGYIAVGASEDDTGLRVTSLADNINRLFVQWAGMTAGLSQSFYDFWSTAAMQYTPLQSSDTGDTGWWVWAYTAQFGGGFSGSISAEARRLGQIIDANCLATTASTCGTITPGAYPAAITVGGVGVTAGGGIAPGAGAYGGMQAPDIVANLRVDQTWGGAQIMGVLHQVNATYYSSTLAGAPSAASLAHPSDAWGWAAGAGIKLNFPMIARGDWFQAQVNVSQGALRYVINTPNTNWGMAHGTDAGNGNEGYGVLSDCVYGGSVAGGAGTFTSCQLTSAWGVDAGYEHFWTPALHSTLYGAYTQVKYGGPANAMLCSAEGSGNGAGTGAAAVATAGCNNNWSTWGVGSRTQWDVTKTFYLGVEVLYQKLQSAQTFNGLVAASQQIGGPPGTATNSVANQSNWLFRIRAHRDFLP